MFVNQDYPHINQVVSVLRAVNYVLMNRRFQLIITALPMNIYSPVGIASDHAHCDRRFTRPVRRLSV
jgi:hypothetical protein